MAVFAQSASPVFEVYRSMSLAALAELETVAMDATAATPFTIELRFVGGLTQTQMDAFAAAADRWTRVVVGDLPSVTVDGEVVDDLVILAQGAAIDGRGGTLGQAGPTHLRPAAAGAAAFLPAKGRMTFDTADLEEMDSRGTLVDVIAHEMGHVLGFGTVWEQQGLLDGAGTGNPTFRGRYAMQEYSLLRSGAAVPVPVEHGGGRGTADCHWREMLFRHELMSGFITASGNALSRMTAASLRDLGYEVDLDAADPYRLADLFELAEAGVLAGGESLALSMLPILPIILPDRSLA